MVWPLTKTLGFCILNSGFLRWGLAFFLTTVLLEKGGFLFYGGIPEALNQRGY